jgi:hypothetical protein
MAQTTIIKDSLLKLLPVAKEDTAAVWLYINIGNEYVLKQRPDYYLRAGQLTPCNEY